jgi:translation initiation factor IF-3
LQRLSSFGEGEHSELGDTPLRPRRNVEPPVRPASQHRINEQIRAPKVRLVDENSEQIGIKQTAEALEYAYSKGLDLVEIAAQADPPVAKVMDYGKFRYEEEQKAKLARKHQSQIHVKEIKLRPKIQVHDYNTKKGHVERFLNQRAKVKVTIMFRGRETTHPERGRDLLMRLAEDVKDIGVVEQPPLLDGRNMVMVLGPTKNAGAPKQPGDTRDAEAEDTQRSEEAVQGDGRREAPAPPGDEESHAGEEVAEAEAELPSGRAARA